VQTLLAAETQEELAIELIQNVRPANVRKKFFGLLDQRLHNMLASAMSLVDHTRRLIRGYEGGSFATEFRERNDAVRAAHSSVFLRDLRNYLLHYELIPFAHSVSLPDGQNRAGLVSEVRVRCSDILAWKGWNSAAKSYMSQCGESVHLVALAKQYVKSMDDLYDWVFEQFEELHGDDVDATNELVAEHNLTLTGEVTDGRDWYERMAKIEQQIRSRAGRGAESEAGERLATSDNSRGEDSKAD
jgi:hypothetical protein